MADSYRLTPFATRLLRERCRCWIIGDSINAEGGSNQNMPRGWIRQLQPRAWAGIGVSSVNDGGVSPAFRCVAGAGAFYGFGVNDPGTPGGGADVWQCQYGAVTDYGNLSDASPTMFQWQGTAAQAAGFLSDAGAWWTGNTGTVRPIWHTDADTVLEVNTITQRNAVTISASTNRVLTADTYDHFDLGIGTGATTGNAWIRAKVGYNETGLNMRPLMARWFVSGVSGLELFFGGVGGSTVEDHVDTGKVSDAAIEAAVAKCEIDTVMIWLGQNGTVDATWNTNMLALIDRWRSAVTAAGRVFKCLLISTYDANGGSKYAAIADYEEAIAREYSDVSFLNLFARAGGFVYLNGLAGTCNDRALQTLGLQTEGESFFALDAVDGSVTGTLVAGDVLTVTSTGEQYTVTATATAAANQFLVVNVTPELTTAYADNTAVGVGRYLRDGVHPNAVGYDYFAGLIQTELSGALIGETGAGGGQAPSASTALRLGLI